MVLTISELEERIALIRRNIDELIEQAAAYSGAGDEVPPAKAPSWMPQSANVAPFWSNRLS
jgi:hypothetical protein